MNVIFPLQTQETPLQDTVVAIGVFDGVHRGHQEILRQTVREAASQGYQPVVLTFDIQPTELFAPDRCPSYITSLPQRTALIDEFGGGIAHVAVARFDKDFASLSPTEFVSEILEAKLGARHVLVGADFKYGRGRSGSVTTLLEAALEDSFTVTVVPPILVDHVRISSTEIRRLISEGDLPSALRLLGHGFVLAGRVVTGKRLGRTLGFPTANLAPAQANALLPGNGVYGAWALLQDGRRVRAAVSVGVNPTTDGDQTRKVEAYLMDGFSGDLYDQPLSLDFQFKVRDEWKFETLDALVTRIQRDVAEIASALPLP